MSLCSTLNKLSVLSLLIVIGQSCSSAGREEAKANTNTEQPVAVQPEPTAAEELPPEIDPTDPGPPAEQKNGQVI
jgi:hypothetical protein